jgi:MFS transporter, DHA1 family, tetracycline resistance protein
VFSTLGLILFAFASQSWMVYAFTLVYCLGGIAAPSLQGIISARMPANEQGELQGMIGSLIGLSNILSPLIMTNLFYFFTKENSRIYFPGASFAMAAILVFFGFLLSIGELRNKRI